MAACLRAHQLQCIVPSGQVPRYGCQSTAVSGELAAEAVTRSFWEGSGPGGSPQIGHKVIAQCVSVCPFLLLCLLAWLSFEV